MRKVIGANVTGNHTCRQRYVCGYEEYTHIVVIKSRVMFSDTLPVILYKKSAGRHGHLVIGPHIRTCGSIVTLGHAIVGGNIQACPIPFGGGGITNAPFVGLVAVHQHPVFGLTLIECAIIVVI